MAEPSSSSSLPSPAAKQLHRYIWRDTGGHGPIDLSAPSATHLPVIDLTLLLSSSSAIDAPPPLLNLRSALSTWGCFQLVNHGIEASLLEKLHQLSREFFHLPIADKQTCTRSEGDYEGYGEDLVLFENQSLDWTERVYLLVTPQANRKLKYWPKNPESFRDVLSDYTDKLVRIKVELLKAMARSLSLSENCFVKQFGEHPTMYARFNFYPPCSIPDRVLGLKPHADGSGITFLLQDKNMEGLQLLRDGQWFRVLALPNALLVNVGDQIEIMSNGVFKSPVHRAVTNSERERNTLAMFCSPDPEQEIEPVEELVDETRPRMFKKVRNYPETYFHYFQQGKRPIDAVWPSRIVVFRDGVSDGQFDMVLNQELQDLREELAGNGCDSRIKITLIVAQKRHRTRLFVQNERGGGGVRVRIRQGQEGWRWGGAMCLLERWWIHVLLIRRGFG